MFTNEEILSNKQLKKNIKRTSYSDSKHWKSPLAYSFYIPIIIALIYIPIICMIFFSFNSSNSLIVFKGFSTRWYERLFRSSEIMDALMTSLSVAIISTIVSIILGTLGAIGLSYISNKRKSVRNMLLTINNIPIASPEIVTAIALMILFTGFGANLGFFTILISHISFCTPYVILSVYPKMIKIDKFLIEASMDLGSTKTKSLFKVILPELFPSIISGGMLSFTMSLDDFVISYFVGGSTNNISSYLYSLKKTNPSVNALSTILVIVILVIVVVAQIIQYNQNKQMNSYSYKNKKITNTETLVAAIEGSNGESSNNATDNNFTTEIINNIDDFNETLE